MGGVLADASISQFLRDHGIPEEVALVAAAFIHAFLLINFFAVVPLLFIWAERKISGRIQDRLGPTRVGGRFGWLQGLADGVKLIQKEDLVPEAADGMLFRMAPYLVCVASFGAFMFLPFSDGWVAVAADVGLFAMFAILSLEVFGIILAGYSSGSKWSLYGGMREAAQMVSYEIPLAIAALVPVVAVGSLNLQEIGDFQRGPHWFLDWLIFHDPFTFVAFFVYFTVATASCKRAPFDLAEAESELVGGFHTEYSGMRWSFFFMAEYASMFLVSAVASYLFLGGWHTGISPLDNWLGGLRGGSATASGFVLSSYIANLIGMVVILSKGSLLVCVQIWVRWTLPRLRIDQVMMTCLKYLVPITCFLFLGAVLWPLVLTAAMGRPTLFPPKSMPKAAPTTSVDSGNARSPAFRGGGGIEIGSSVAQINVIMSPMSPLRGFTFAQPRESRGFRPELIAAVPPGLDTAPSSAIERRATLGLTEESSRNGRIGNPSYGAVGVAPTSDREGRP